MFGVGMLLFVVAAGLFGFIAEDVVTSDRLTLLDVRIAQWLHLHGSPRVTQWMLVVSQLHSTFAMTFYIAILSIAASVKRQWRRLSTLMLCMVGGMLLNVLMKLVFHRARPHFSDPIVTLTSYSFPSGHVAASTIFYTLGVVWVFGQTRAISWRMLAVTTAALAILLVAFSRMYLGVHYLSDVGAAFAEGVAWVALCMCALAVDWRKTRFSRVASVAEEASSRREPPR